MSPIFRGGFPEKKEGASASEMALLVREEDFSPEKI